MSYTKGKCLFILGAGASVEAGAPLMATFLDRARNILSAGDLSPTDRDSFELVFRAVSQLQLAHSKSELDIHNLEPVFSAFEMASLFDRDLNTLSKNEIQKLPEAMRTLIVRTLEESISFNKADFTSINSLGVASPGPYTVLSKLIQRDPQRFSIITFNYDLLTDIALLSSNLKIDYGMLPKGMEGYVPLLKLHGSTNWKRCQCGEIHAIPLETVLGDRGYRNGAIRNWDTATSHLRAKVCVSQATDISNQCNQQLETGLPFIVPPTWNKGVSSPTIRRVWAAAARELSEAEIIVVIGYSMPESDQFFRYLYGLGTIGGAIIRRFILCDPDRDGNVEKRFRRQLGAAVLDRFKAITGEKATFGVVMNSMEAELDLHRMARGL